MPESSRTRKHFANGAGAPKCGRQLSRPGSTITNQSSMQITSDLSEVKCRHCLRTLGLLAPLRRAELEDAEHLEDELETEADDEMG